MTGLWYVEPKCAPTCLTVYHRTVPRQRKIRPHVSLVLGDKVGFTFWLMYLDIVDFSRFIVYYDRGSCHSCHNRPRFQEHAFFAQSVETVGSVVGLIVSEMTSSGAERAQISFLLSFSSH